MNRHVQRLGAMVLTLAVLLGTVPAAFADRTGDFDGDRGGGFIKSSFGSATTRFLSPVRGYTAAQNGDPCAKSENTFHVAQVKSRGGGTDSIGAYSSGICTSCGASFKVYESDVQRSYGENTEKLPSQGVDSEGYLYWYPKFLRFRIESGYSSVLFWYGDMTGSGVTVDNSRCPFSITVNMGGLGGVSSVSGSSLQSGGLDGSYYFRFTYRDAAPVSGYYAPALRTKYSYSGLDSSGTTFKPYSVDYSFDDPTYFAAGNDFSGTTQASLSPGGKFSYFNLLFHPMLVKIKPLSGLVDTSNDNSYGSSTRPGSSDFGFYFGDDNKLLLDNVANIVNEVNNTYYNPITNTTNNYNNWSYDYSSRTYTLNNTDNSTTTTITYGDEYITIKEGDTIYNIYYYVQQDSSQTPSTCQHEYTSAVTTAATCTTAGVMTYTCSKCQNSYTEAIPATGHTWQVAQTVEPETDEDGNVTQKGYTLYRCSVCSTEYKSESGEPPPSGGDDSDGNSIWDKLGSLIGSIFNGILSVLGGILGKVLDALISLVGMLTDKLTALVESILTIFDTLPTLFTGFTGFLGAVFGFLPSELLLVMEFGLVAVLFVGLLLLIFKR